MKHTKHIYTRTELNAHIKHWFECGYNVINVNENELVMVKGDKTIVLKCHLEESENNANKPICYN